MTPPYVTRIRHNGSDWEWDQHGRTLRDLSPTRDGFESFEAAKADADEHGRQSGPAQYIYAPTR